MDPGVRILSRASLLIGNVGAQQSWVDELNGSLNFYKTSYPGANWEPYSQRLAIVKDAIGRGDTKTVKTEMGKWFKMLRTAIRVFTTWRRMNCSTLPS